MPGDGDGLHAPQGPAAAGGSGGPVPVDGSQLEIMPRSFSLGELGGDVLVQIMDRAACGRCAWPLH